MNKFTKAERLVHSDVPLFFGFDVFLDAIDEVQEPYLLHLPLPPFRQTGKERMDAHVLRNGNVQVGDGRRIPGMFSCFPDNG